MVPFIKRNSFSKVPLNLLRAKPRPRILPDPARASSTAWQHQANAALARKAQWRFLSILDFSISGVARVLCLLLRPKSNSSSSGCAGLLRLIAALALCGLASAEETGAIIVKDNDDLFSIPAFVIGVRESIEGCVIAAVLLNACHKSGQLQMKVWVWFGIIVGCVSFLVAGAICLIVFYSIRKNMPGAGKAAFEGVLAVLACCVLTHISLKFLRLKDLIMKWESKLVQDKNGEQELADKEAAPPRRGCWAGFMDWIADFRAALHINRQAIDKTNVEKGELTPKMIVLMAWSAIFREGLETVIFLLPLTGTTKEAGLVAGCLAGIACGIAFGLIVLYVGKVLLIDPTWFFNLTTLFIFFIAAGLSTYSVIEIEQIWAVELKKINHPVYYRPMYNIGCLHEVFGRVWTHEMDTKCFLPENEGKDRKRGGGVAWLNNKCV
jgi:FTR1 family protein